MTELFKSKLYVETVPEDKDITQALNDFIKKHHVNILAMMPHKHTLTERLLRKSETKDMIFNTGIPIVVLPQIHIEPEWLEECDLQRELHV
jgi:hypothetical protein